LLYVMFGVLSYSSWQLVVMSWLSFVAFVYDYNKTLYFDHYYYHTLNVFITVCLLALLFPVLELIV